MCGIAFVVNYGKQPLDLGLVRGMFKSMEARGTDASGIYYERPDENGTTISRVVKAPVKASELWDMIQDNKGDVPVPEDFANKFKLDGTEKLIMLHTRAKTHGTFMDNNNNMPIFSDDWVLVHNGVVYAEPMEGFTYRGKVDSEEILAGAQVLGDVKKAIERLSGSMAIALRKRGTNDLFIYRNSNPLELVAVRDSQVLFGCSMDYYVTNEMGEEIMTSDVKNVFNRHNVFTATLKSCKLYRLDTETADLEELDNALPGTTRKYSKKEAF